MTHTKKGLSVITVTTMPTQHNISSEEGDSVTLCTQILMETREKNKDTCDCLQTTWMAKEEKNKDTWYWEPAPMGPRVFRICLGV